MKNLWKFGCQRVSGIFAEKSLELFLRHRKLASDIALQDGNLEKIASDEWLAYWRKNPVRAWTGKRWFRLENGKFCPAFLIANNERETFHSLLQELIDHRLAAYEARPTNQIISAEHTDANHSQTVLVYNFGCQIFRLDDLIFALVDGSFGSLLCLEAMP